MPLSGCWMEDRSGGRKGRAHSTQRPNHRSEEVEEAATRHSAEDEEVEEEQAEAGGEETPEGARARHAA